MEKSEAEVHKIGMLHLYMLLSRNRVTFLQLSFWMIFHVNPALTMLQMGGFILCSFLHLFQATKVNITVHAIVTTSDLEINPAQIDFGYCTIYEAVQANIVLTNKSILPQEFGFVGLPEVCSYPTHTSSGIKIDLIMNII